MYKRFLPTSILGAYCVFLVKVMVLKEVPIIRIGHMMFKFGGTESGRSSNFVPLKTIVPYLFGHKGWVVAGINLMGNIGLLVPVGFLVPFIYSKITWQKFLALALVVPLIIEGVQIFFRIGIFDIDDVILNALGVMIGYCFYIVLVRDRRH